MTFIHNRPEKLIHDFYSGLVAAHSQLTKHDHLPLIYYRDWDQSQVPILTGGGSGHEPSHSGFIGKGMVTAALYGPLFVPPQAEEILEAIQFLDKGKGVFVIIKNFEADLYQFRKAILKAKDLGHQVRYIVSHDDISIEPKNHFQIRGRGLAGTILLHKILGYLAQNGASLDALEQAGFEVATHTATIGFATKSASTPPDCTPLFELPDTAISYGIGIHGEEGYRTVPFQSSEALAVEIINKLKLHYHWKKDQPFVLLVNNLGSTTELEMGIFLNDLLQLCDIEGLTIPLIKTGKFMTSLDMSGISVTLCQLQDNHWLEALHAPTDAFAW
ncbi:DhaKLM operon coactivator DhaQ [Streptococcus cameli]